MIVICDICRQPIAKAEAISNPPQPQEFQSLMPERGVGAPFLPEQAWIDFLCPYCRMRPFHSPDEVTVMDVDGFRVVETGTNHVCQDCGKAYKHQSSLIRHRKEVHEN